MSTHDFTDAGGDTGCKNGDGGSETRQDPGVAILDFQTFGILTVDGFRWTVCVVVPNFVATGDRLNRYKDMAI